jgi:phenylacetate-CoA ligase
VSWLHNNILLPVLERERHRGLGARLRRLQQFEAMPEARQRAEQAVRVSRILQHAYETVPFYRQEFEAMGSHPRDWKPGQPVPLPITGREHLRDRQAEMISTLFKPEDLRTASTGGTTSTPVQLKRNLEGLRDKTALQYQLNRWAGYDQGDRTLLVWGMESDLSRNPSWRRRLYDETVMGRIPAPAGQINQQVLENFRDRMNHYRPKVVFGYGVTMSLLAEFLLESGGLEHQPKIAIVTAEAISRKQKNLIEKAFGCRVTEHYGSREVGMVASECEQHDGLHFHPAGCLVELRYEGDVKEGPMYRLILTDLLNYGLPLLRYDTGDNVLLADGECPCGRWFPRVKSILGRAMDTFILADGSEIPGLSLNNNIIDLMHGFRYVVQLQVIQKTVDFVQLVYVTVGDEAQTAQELALVREALQNVFKVPLQSELVRVDNIPRARSGKLRMCISEVKRTPRDRQRPTPAVS